MRNVRVDRAEFSDPETDLAGPDPAVVVFDVFGERQFGPGEHAYRDSGIALGSEAAGRSAAECGGDQRLSHLGGARRYSVQAIVTHGIAPRLGDSQPAPLRGAGLYRKWTVGGEPWTRWRQFCGFRHAAPITNAFFLKNQKCARQRRDQTRRR